MRADQKIIVGGTLDGKRVVSDPLPAYLAIYQFHAMRRQGYSLLTMTDAETGRDYDIGGFMTQNPAEKQ